MPDFFSGLLFFLSIGLLSIPPFLLWVNYKRNNQTRIGPSTILVSRITGIFSYVIYFSDKLENVEIVEEIAAFTRFKFERFPVELGKPSWRISYYDEAVGGGECIMPINKDMVLAIRGDGISLRNSRKIVPVAEYRDYIDRAEKLYAKTIKKVKAVIEKTSRK